MRNKEEILTEEDVEKILYKSKRDFIILSVSASIGITVILFGCVIFK